MDRKAIESLGFKFDSQEGYFTHEEYELKMYWLEEDSKFKIENEGGVDESGTITNIGELVKWLTADCHIEDLTLVRVKDLVRYLTENFDPNASIHIDKDGWMETSKEWCSPIELIEKRSVFTKHNASLYINN